MRAVFALSNGTTTTARQSVDELLARLTEDASALGTRWALNQLSDLADAGGPAARPREVLNRTGDAVAVIRDLVERTANDSEATSAGLAAAPSVQVRTPGASTASTAIQAGTGTQSRAVDPVDNSRGKET